MMITKDINIVLFELFLMNKKVIGDSEFMLKTMGEIGLAIREKMHWVPIHIPIYLVLDNAGGHGTKTAVTNYTKYRHFWIG